MGKKRISISVSAESFEEAKELLDDLEVLKDKYDMEISLHICTWFFS